MVCVLFIYDTPYPPYTNFSRGPCITFIDTEGGDLRTLLKSLVNLDTNIDLTSPTPSLEFTIHSNQQAVTADVLGATLGTCSLEDAFNCVGKSRNKTEFVLRAVLF